MVHLEQARATGSATAARPLPAGLLRALAQAADGIRNREVYFVACLEPKGSRYEVSPAFLSLEEAEESARQRNELHSRKNGPAGEIYGCFGPFHTAESVKAKRRVAKLRVEIDELGEDGKKTRGRPLEIPGDRFDSLFYSLSAVEKFLLPYYASVHGLEYANQIRETFVTQDLLLMGHLPNTESTEVDPGGQESTQRKKDRITAVRLVDGELTYEIV